MLEFLIAVFGGTYFLSRLGYEKARKVGRDAAWNEHRTNEAQWQEKWTNEELERQLMEYVSDYNNYSVVMSELSQMLNDVPEMRKRIGFCSSEWYECGLYPYYWKTQCGFTAKQAKSQSYYMRCDAVLTMLAARGLMSKTEWTLCYAGNGLNSRPMPLDIEFFKWCVKKMRSVSGMSDPVVRIERNGPIDTHRWEYALEPMVLPGFDYVEVSDDEIVMMPK